MRGRPSVRPVKIARSKVSRRKPGRPTPRDTSVSRPGASIGGSGNSRARALTSNFKRRTTSVRRRPNVTKRPIQVRQVKVRGAYNANIKYKNYGIGFNNPMGD